METTIRQEIANDFESVFKLVEEAFKTLQISDHTEQFLVDRLRKSEAFIPELSLVAVDGEKVVGYILLTKVNICNNDKKFEALTLAPVAVLPAYQNLGIGGKLIKQVHAAALKLGFGAVILVGHPDYYPRFGYKKASDFGIRQPFDAPDECCMAIELYEGSLSGITGIVEYSKAFGFTDVL